MFSVRSTGHFRMFIATAIVGLLALLLLVPGEVRGQNAPTITGGATTKSIAENTETTEVIDTYTASDADMDMLSWSLGGDDSEDFAISTSGELTFKVVPDFEMPADTSTDNIYNVTVVVSDSEATPRTATRAVTITVTDVNEVPEISTTVVAYNFAENTDVDETPAATIEAADPESGDMLTWTLSGLDAEFFEIDKDSEDADQDGVLKFKSSPDFENPTDKADTVTMETTDNVYKVTVNVRDSLDGDGSADTAIDDSIELKITVTDANDAPEITSTGTTFTAISSNEGTSTSTILATYMASDEDRPAQTLTWSLEGTDAGDFDINSSTGALTFKNVPDYEIPADNGANNVYNVTVKVTDNGSPMMDDTQAVTVTVNNVNEEPTITSTGTGFTAPSFMEIEYDATSPDLSVATYTATDPDTQTGNTLTWSKTGGDAGDFDIDSSTGELTFKNPPNYEGPEDGDTNNDYNITVKVRDNGIPGDRGTGNQLEDTITVTVTVTDVNERPDIMEDTVSSYSEIEYDHTGTRPDVHTFSAQDYDDGDTFTWSLGGEDSADLNIGSTSGVLTFDQAACANDGPLPDYEEPCDGSTDGTNTYNINVIATDNHDKAGTYAVTVAVTNVDETPEITAGSDSPSFAEIEYDATSPVLTVETYTARDEEGETITWSVDGTDADDFSIGSSDGMLSFSSSPNFEIPTDRVNAIENYVADDNMYQIIVKATDGNTSVPNETNITDYPVTVTVTDVNERPDIAKVTNDGLEYVEVDFYYTLTPDSVHTFTATDYDGDGFEWSLLGTDAGDLSIGATTGILTFDQDSTLNVGPLPSFEDPQDDNADNVYNVTVRATDDDTSDQKFTDYDVAITVTDEEEAGAIAVAHMRDGQEIVGSDLTDLDVDDVLEFTLSDPDTIPTPLTDGAIDWVIERRNQGETDDDWVALTGQDVTSLNKEYTIDEDDTGKEIRATVTYTDRRGSGKMAESDDTDAAMDEREIAPPRFRSGDMQTIPEGPAGRDTEVEIMATDKDGEVLIFGIQDGPNSDLFEILPSDSTVERMIDNVLYTGYMAQLRAVEELDYEALSPDTTFELTLTLTDGKALRNGRVVDDDETNNDYIDATYDVTIEVTDVDEQGEITFSPEEVPEPGVPITATLTDPDGSISGRSWQWQRSEDPEADPPVWDDISGATSSTYTPDATDDVVSGGNNDGDGYYLRATVSYTDGEGSGKSATADAGQVGTANTRPQFPSSETGQRAVPENSRSGTNIGDPVAAEDPENNSLTYTLTGNDAESFSIVSSTGQLRVKEPLDFETRSTYIVTIDVTDRRDAAGRSSTYIDDTLESAIIRVENVEEEGTVTLSTPTNRVQATVPVTAELSDPDVVDGAVSWQWARSANRSDWEDIATGASYTPTATDDQDADEEDQGKYLRATASYTDGEGPDKTAKVVTARVAGPPPTNAAPVFPDAEDGQREVREDAGTGTLVGGPVAATDFNNDTLTYSLSGFDSEFFTIGANDGQLRLELEQDEALDYERKRTYRFTVRVSDGKNDAGEDDDVDNLRIDDSITVTVNITNVNEAPVITGESEREFRENGTGAVATYSARDPEGDSITWSVGGVDSDSFVITDKGQLYFNEPPSYEARTPSEYNVIVDASDGTLTSRLNVTVTVIDVEERGTVTIFPTRGWVVDAVEDDPDTMDVDESLPALATRFTATLEDGDTPLTNIAWQWYRSSGVEIDGATSSSYTATADDVGRTLRVTATYQDNRSVDPMDPTDITEKMVSATLRSPIRGTSPGVNTQPRFNVPESEEMPGGRFDTRTIRSGTVAGRAVGARVSARDTDGDVLTYMLQGRDADKFEIDPGTGQIRTKEALDYLEQDTYTLSVSVHDSFDSLYRPSASVDDTISIVITVLPPPPPPRRTVSTATTEDDSTPNRAAEFSDGEATNRSVVQGVEPGTDVGRPVSASDPDGDPLTYTLGGDNAESFDIDASTGQLRTKAALYAETKASYSVTVSVTDNKNAGGGRYAAIDDTIAVNITVTTVELSEVAKKYDADEDGLISLDEAVRAVNDYFSGDITRDEALEVIAFYFEAPIAITAPPEENR